MKNILKILTALATIAGAVYIIATYGEQIVAWAKKLWNAMPKCPNCEEAEIIEELEAEEVSAEEPAAEEEVVSEDVAEEPVVEEVVVEEAAPVAEENDFEAE